MSQVTNIRSKIISRTELPQLISSWKQAGAKVVFTNGCFDILHQGHVTYLAKARDLGDKLIVGLNTDSSVRMLDKDPSRPVNNEQARATVLAALSSVDAVVPFDEATPLNLINEVQPNVLAKGADYDPSITDAENPKYIVGANEVKAAGGAVAAIELEEGFSTTNIIDHIKNG